MNTKDTVSTESIDALFNAGAHFGFSRSRRHPSMAPFIFGVKNKVEIFDLEKVSDRLDATKAYMKALGKDKKQVLFVGGKNEARAVVKEVAEELEQPYVAGRWIGGSLTNFSEIKKRIGRLADLVSKRDKGELAKFTKLEQLHIDREITDLDKTFGGLARMADRLPQAMLVIDTKHEEIAVAEATTLGIPVIGLLNSDCNADGVEHFIPGNDSSVASISYFLNELKEAYKEGLAEAPAPKAEAETKEPVKK